MRKISFQIAVAALIMIAVCAIFRFVRGNTIVDVRLNPGLADQVEWGEPPADLTVTYDEEGIVRVEKVRIRGDVMEVKLRAVSAGTSGVRYTVQGKDIANGYSVFQVG